MCVCVCVSQEALTIEEQLLEQRDAELRQVQKQVEKVLHESKTHLQALEEEKERTRIQVSPECSSVIQWKRTLTPSAS